MIVLSLGRPVTGVTAQTLPRIAGTPVRNECGRNARLVIEALES
jgi:hypothetical protein